MSCHREPPTLATATFRPLSACFPGGPQSSSRCLAPVPCKERGCGCSRGGLDASTVQRAGTVLLKSPTAVKEVAVTYAADGSAIRIDGHNLTASIDPGKAIAITAPNATQVLLNGTRVKFTRSGSTVYAAAPA